MWRRNIAERHHRHEHGGRLLRESRSARTTTRFGREVFQTCPFLWGCNQTNTRESTHPILEHFLDKSSQTLAIQTELAVEQKDITETAAGIELDGRLAEIGRKCREESEKVRIELTEAIQAKDDQSKQELDEVRRQLQAEIHRIDEDRQRLSFEYAENKRKVMDLQQKLKDEEARRRQCEDELTSLRALLNQTKSTANKKNMQRRIDELRKETETRRVGAAWSNVFGVVGEACNMTLASSRRALRRVTFDLFKS